MKDFKNFFETYYNGALTNCSIDEVITFCTNMYDENQTLLVKKEIDETYQFLLNHTKNQAIIQSILLSHLSNRLEENEKIIKEKFGHYIYDMAVYCYNLDIKDKFSFRNKADYSFRKLKLVFEFAEEYKSPILFTILYLGDIKCKLINQLKVNHALETGLKAYVIGGVKNDGVVAALTSDVLTYSPHREEAEEIIKTAPNDILYGSFSGQKVLAYSKGLGCDKIINSEGIELPCINLPWKKRKMHQLNHLKTPGKSSYSANIIIAISKTITLNEVAKIIKETEVANPKFKEEFWKDYENITEKEAIWYYSEIYKILYNQHNIPIPLLENLEDAFNNAFDQKPF